jgi:uncharacterized membrane protein
MENQPPQLNPEPSSLPPQKTGMGMEPNLAAALSYVCGWITGLVFFLMEKENSFVRFHAMQSIIVSGALTVLWIGLSVLPLGFLYWFIAPLLSLVGFVLWILLIIKAYQGQRFHLPVAGDIAEKNSK